MSGPVWRFAREAEATCATCFRKVNGVFVEGEIVGNEMQTLRSVCPECYRGGARMVVRGESGGAVHAPGYSHR